MYSNFKFCPVCGLPPKQQNNSPPVQNYYQNNYYQAPQQNIPGLKSESTTLILSIVLGLLGIQGVGHMYVGKVGKGIGILIGALILGTIGVLTIWVGVGVIFLIIYFIMLIWQIFDSRNLCKQYNDYLLKTGKPPW
jgi:TM2 domain-containing membrane protein YozV